MHPNIETNTQGTTSASSASPISTHHELNTTANVPLKTTPQPTAEEDLAMNKTSSEQMVTTETAPNEMKSSLKTTETNGILQLILYRELFKLK